MKLDYATNTYKHLNEDTFGHTKTSAFVIDGASSLVKNNYTPLNNDVVWFVMWWKKYLQNNLDNTHLTIHEIISNGIQLANSEYSNYIDIHTLSNIERVSASIAIVRKNANRLETYILGDCEIRLLHTNEQVTQLKDNKIELLDNQVKQLMASNKNRQNELVFKDFTQAELNLLRENRQKMNTLEGYYILSHDLQAVNHGIYNEYDFSTIDQLIIQSDGLVILDDFYSPVELFRKMEKGVLSCIEHVRYIEKKDQQMQKVVRLKQHDDATAIFISLENKRTASN